MQEFTFFMFKIASIFCALSLVLTFFATGGGYEVWLLSGGQFALLFALVREKHATAVTMFVFMSFLFFGMRPIYILLEGDHNLFYFPFSIAVDGKVLNSAQWWGTLALLCFCLGARLPRKLHLERWRRMRKIAKAPQNRVVVNDFVALGALAYQVGSLGIMFIIGGMGRSLYESEGGAWVYEFPAVLQGGQIFALAVLFERYWKMRAGSTLVAFMVSAFLFLAFTYEMRNVSIFRGFYLTGFAAGALAVFSRIRQSVNALWLIIPILLALPIFRMLGELRSAENEQLVNAIQETLQVEETPFIQRYWEFYNSRGDINIFDTFVAAKESTPSVRPYVLSWLYVPVHWIPRAIWESKPERGILVDVSFTNGAPYSPGISGFFMLDGGLFWMLGCMALLGYIIAYVDTYLLCLPAGYLRSCLYGIFVVTAMGGSRYFLYQYFYQLLYAALPVIFLSWLVVKLQGKSPAKRRVPKKRPKPASAPSPQQALARGELEKMP
jgi:hypothetical protein